MMLVTDYYIVNRRILLLQRRILLHSKQKDLATVNRRILLHSKQKDLATVNRRILLLLETMNNTEMRERFLAECYCKENRR